MWLFIYLGLSPLSYYLAFFPLSVTFFLPRLAFFWISWMFLWFHFTLFYQSEKHFSISIHLMAQLQKLRIIFNVFFSPIIYEIINLCQFWFYIAPYYIVSLLSLLLDYSYLCAYLFPLLLHCTSSLVFPFPRFKVTWDSNLIKFSMCSQCLYYMEITWVIWVKVLCVYSSYSPFSPVQPSLSILSSSIVFVSRNRSTYRQTCRIVFSSLCAFCYVGS